MLVSEAKTALMTYGFAVGDPLTTWLEAAKQRVEEADNWPFLMKQVTLPHLAGALVIAGIPADFFKPVSIRDITNKKKLKFMDPVGFDRDIEDPTEVGNPKLYTIRGANPVSVPIWPVPSFTVSLAIFYQSTLADITGLTDPTLLPGPVSFHYIYVLGAASIGLQADNEEDRAEVANTQFEAALGHQRRKWFSSLDEAPTVQDVMGYGDS